LYIGTTAERLALAPSVAGAVFYDTTTGYVYFWSSTTWLAYHGTKASSADINTGTDDAKYVTAAAIAGSNIVFTDKVQALSNKTLTAPIVAILKPVADSTTAIQITQADGATPVMVYDTTNKRVGIGTTPTAKFHVVGQADEVECKIQAYTGQVSNVFELVTASGNAMFAVSQWGDTVISNGSKAVTSANKLYVYSSNTDTTIARNAIKGEIFITNTAIVDTLSHTSVAGIIYGAGTQNHSGVISAFTASAYAANTAGASSYIIGYQANVGNTNTGTVNSVYGLRITICSPGAGAITTLYGAEISYYTATAITMYGLALPVNTGATGTSKYAIFVNDVSGAATNNYALYTKAGAVTFNASNAAEADFTVKMDTYSAIVVDTSADSLILVNNVAGKLGFYGVAAIVQPSAYTQTYSTASKTHPNATAAALTDNTGGTPSTTLAAIEAIYTQATIADGFASLTAMTNKNTADILAVKQLVNAVIDDLQALGLAG
jgi:hypothetical protein